uniref:Glycoside hydrolase family 5 n=1 Tax=uncultured bacterium contig00032 TaxID=1181521 RepID=A0A806JYQ6_9BACT|nr:glycoside hydrolase family 5 [uncultured bacterium contig00032]
MKKKIFTRLFAIVCVVLFVTSLTLTSCTDGDDSGTTPTPGGNGEGGSASVTFSSVTASGSPTTSLTLTFSQAVTGLTTSNITLSGVSGVTKGTLSGSGPTYTLGISGTFSSGTLTVAVAKSGFTFSPASRTVAVTGGSGVTNDPRPSSPESMTTKTAMQYFTDEGITVGINVGNSLDAVDAWSSPGKPMAIETAWGNPVVNQTYITGLKNLGFKIIRIPVTWNGHIGSAPNYTIEESYLKRVAEVAGYAEKAGLKAFINIHHDGHHDLGGWLFKAFDNDAATVTKFEKVWTQIAEYFKNYGDWLMFQGFNELHTGDWGEGNSAQYAVINNLNQKFTDAVRATGGNNAKRFLLYYGYNTHKTIATNSNFALPNDGANGTTRQIVGFHYYYPYDFSLEAKNHTYTGFESTLASDLAAFKTKFVDNDIPVIIGENGPARYSNYPGNTGYNQANVAAAKANRLTFIDLLYGTARSNGLVPIYWENGAYDSATAEEGDFSLINRNNGTANSTESAEVITRMITAVNNATPPGGGTPTTPPGGGTGTTAVWTSYNPNIDSKGSTATLTLAGGQYTFTGSLSAESESYAQAVFNPDTATLTAMRSMTSFSFKVTGDGKQYEVMLPTSESNVSYNHYRYRFTAPAAETTITVNVPDNLSQANWGGAGVVEFVKNNIQNMQFQPVVSGSFSLKVWDIRTYQ